MPTFKRAERKQTRLRMTIDGPAGAGKTYTALRFAHALANGGRIAVVDTEHGSASKYEGTVIDGGKPWCFDVAELSDFSPSRYTEMINEAGRAGYVVLIIDSLSHAWEGVGGALDLKDRQGGNQWTAWRTVTPIHNRMVDAILQSPCHVITTMRSRMEYIQEQDERGKVVIRQVGMAPVQRPGISYEFDLVLDLDWNHVMRVSKSRCPAVADLVVDKPGPAFMIPVIEWLTSGSVVHVPPPITLDEMIARYGAEAILAVMGGAIPSTPDELAGVAQALAAQGTE